MNELEIYRGRFAAELPLPFADGGIRAGFPSPAEGGIDRTLDFNRELVPHPAATFYARVMGVSMVGAGEFSMKYLDLTNRARGEIWLRPANDSFPPIKVTPEDDFAVWGVVTKVIKNLR